LTQFISDVSSEWSPVQTGSLSPSNSSTRASHHVSKHHKSGEDNFKTKTKTITEDCTASDDVESSTTVETVSSTKVPKTTTVTKIRIDLVTTKSLHKPKHTRYHYTETEVETETETIESPTPTSSESSETHTKHHKSKSKHHSKHHTKHHTKHNTTEIVETPVPTSVESSSQSSSDTSVQEVVVVTTEQVEVVTTGIEEVVSTITLSEGDSRLSTLTTASSTESSDVAPWRTSEPFLPYHITPLFPPLFTSPHLPPFLSTQLPNSFWHGTESVTDDSTTRTGHKTKEPPSINTVETPSSSSTTEYIPHITGAPEFPPTETFDADELVETLVARDNGDPDKKRDKYLKPDKAMSKRMSRWSKHHSDAEEKNWSRHLKHGVKSLEDRIEYDEKHSKKHKTTLAAALPAVETPAAAISPRGDHGDPEKKYQKKMSIASKVYSKFESLADSRYEKQQSKAMKKSSKAREKSLAKERQSEEKAFSKELKSRIKNQKEEDGYGGLAAREVISTPKKNVAKPTATVTVMQTVGGGNYNGTGTLSTSWRTKHASKTASLSTTVGGGN
jgi:hypothetical protein